MATGDLVDVVGTGWRGASMAVRRNIPLFCGTFLVMLAIVSILQPMIPRWHPHHQPEPVKPLAIHLWLIGIFQSSLLSIAAAPGMVAVHRIILLNENGTAFNNLRRLLFFAAWIASFHILISLPAPFINREDFMASLLDLGVLYAMPRLVMSFPAVALDIKAPLRDSWKRAKKHWWKIVGVMVIGCSPVILTYVLFIQANEMTWILTTALINTMMPAVGAGLASALFKNYDGLTTLGKPDIKTNGL